MAFAASSPHQVAFFVSGGIGLTLASFHVDIFTCNNVIVDSKVSSSLQVVELGSGYYYAIYTPDKAGFYILALSNIAHSFHVIDSADIDEANYVFLTKDTPTTNALKPTLPNTESNPASAGSLDLYLLLVFQSSDWQVGRQTSDWAVTSSGLDSSGNWISTPLVVAPGTYHIVIRNNLGTTKVIKAFLEV